MPAQAFKIADQIVNLMTAVLWVVFIVVMVYLTFFRKKKK